MIKSFASVAAFVLAALLSAAAQEPSRPNAAPLSQLTGVSSSAASNTNAVIEGTNSIIVTNGLSATNLVSTNSNSTTDPDDDMLVLSPVTNEPTDVGAVTNAPTSLPGRLDLEAFRIIADRNIFNPNRSPRGGYRSRRSDRDSRRFAPRPDSFSLVGTMAYEKGQYAFFDGSSSDFRKVVEPSQSIAGYTVKEISTGSVTLQDTNGTQVQLPIGMQMTKRENEAWRLSGPRDVSENSSGSSSYSSSSPASTNSDSTNASSSSSTSSPGPSSASSSGSDAESEVLKRLLQKREEELKK